jgi:hypothetical protein
MRGTGQSKSDGMQRGEGGRANQLVGGYYSGSTGKMRRRLMTMATKAVQNSQRGGGGEGATSSAGACKPPSSRTAMVVIFFSENLRKTLTQSKSLSPYPTRFTYFYFTSADCLFTLYLPPPTHEWPST